MEMTVHQLRNDFLGKCEIILCAMFGDLCGLMVICVGARRGGPGFESIANKTILPVLNRVCYISRCCHFHAVLFCQTNQGFGLFIDHG